MSNYDVEQKVVGEQSLSSELSKDGVDFIGSENSGIIAKLKHSSNLAADLAALYAERPYVYARVIQQLGKSLGSGQVKRLHAQVMESARKQKLEKANAAMSAAKDKAAEKKAEHSVGLAVAEDAVSAKEKAAETTERKSGYGTTVSNGGHEFTGSGRKLDDKESAEKTKKEKEKKAEEPGVKGSEQKVAEAEIGSEQKTDNKKAKADEAGAEKEEKKSAKEKEKTAVKAGKTGGNGGAGGGGGGGFGKSGGLKGGDDGGITNIGGGGSLGQIKPVNINVPVENMDVPSIGGGGADMTPKGEGSGENAVEAYANSGVSYQYESISGLGGKVDEESQEKYTEMKDALPGEEGVEVNDGAADDAHAQAMEDTKSNNEALGESEFDDSITVDTDADTSEIDAQKTQVNSGSDEEMPEAPSVEADYSVVEDVEAEGSAKYDESVSEGEAAFAGADTTIPERGVDDLHIPKVDLEAEAEAVAECEAGSAADVEGLPEEAKGIFDETDFAKEAEAQAQGVAAEVKAADETRKSEVDSAIAEHDETISQTLEEAAANEQSIIEENQAAMDSEFAEQQAAMNEEFAAAAEEQSAAIAEAETQIESERAKTQGEMDKEITKAKADKKAKEDEAERDKNKEKSIFKKIGDALTSAWNAIMDGLKSFVTGLIQGLKTVLCTLLDGFVAVVSAINKDLGEKLKGFVDALKEIISAILDFITECVARFLDAVKDAVAELIQEVVETIEKVVEALCSALQEIWAAFKAVLDAALESLQAFLDALADLFFLILKKAAELAGIDTSIIDKVQACAKKVIESPGTFFSALGTGFVQGFKNFFGANLLANIKAVIQNLLTMWLGSAGLSFPEFSVAGIIKFALQVMGIDVDGILSTLGLDDVYKEISNQTKIKTPWDDKFKPAVNPRLEDEITNKETEIEELKAKLDAATAEEEAELQAQLLAAKKAKNALLDEQEKTLQGGATKEKEEVPEEEEAQEEQKIPSELEKFVNEIKSGGISAIIPYLQAHLGDIAQEMLKEVVKSVVKEAAVKAIAKLATMANPVGGIIAALKGVWDLIQFVRSNLSQLSSLASALLDCLVSAANGQTGAVASAVEAAICQAIPLLIDLVLRLAGLNVGAKLKGIVEKIQKKVRSVIDIVLKPFRAMAAKATKKVQNGVDKLKSKTKDGSLANKALGATSEGLKHKREDLTAYTADDRKKLKDARDAEEEDKKKDLQKERAQQYYGGSKTAGLGIWGSSLSDKVDSKKSADKKKVFNVTGLTSSLKGNRIGNLGVKLDNSETLKKVDAYHAQRRANKQYEKDKKKLTELQRKFGSLSPRRDKEEKKKVLEEINKTQKAISDKEEADRKAMAAREVEYLNNRVKLEQLQAKDTSNMSWYEKRKYNQELSALQKSISDKEAADSLPDPLLAQNGWQIFGSAAKTTFVHNINPVNWASDTANSHSESRQARQAARAERDAYEAKKANADNEQKLIQLREQANNPNLSEKEILYINQEITRTQKAVDDYNNADKNREANEHAANVQRLAVLEEMENDRSLSQKDRADIEAQVIALRKEVDSYDPDKTKQEREEEEKRTTLRDLEAMDTSNMTDAEKTDHAVQVMVARQAVAPYDAKDYFHATDNKTSGFDTTVSLIIQQQEKGYDDEDKGKRTTQQWADLGSKQAAMKYTYDVQDESKKYKNNAEYGYAKAAQQYSDLRSDEFNHIQSWGHGNRQLRDEYHEMLAQAPTVEVGTALEKDSKGTGKKDKK